MHEEDRQLIKRLVLGDSRAEFDFVRHWMPRITGWVRGRAPAHVVQDYAQEVLIHLARDNWSRLLQWHGLYDDTATNPNSLAAFIRTVTVNKTSDLLRADRPEAPTGGEGLEIVDKDSPIGVDPGYQAEQAAKHALLARLIEELKPRDRNILTMWRQGHPYAYIARALGITENNARQRRTYLTRKLWQRFREEWEGDNGDD